MRKIVLGHSVAAGFMDPEGGWPVRVTRALTSDNVKDPDEYFKLYNLAVSGFTTSDIREQVPEELETRKHEEDMMVLLQIGVNDPLFLRDEESYQVSKDDFRENLKHIIKDVQSIAEHFYVLEEHPNSIDGPLPWDSSKTFSQDDFDEYESIKKEVCVEHGVEMIELNSKLKEDFERNLADGLHPNGRGHQMIANIVKEKLKEV